MPWYPHLRQKNIRASSWYEKEQNPRRLWILLIHPNLDRTYSSYQAAAIYISALKSLTVCQQGLLEWGFLWQTLMDSSQHPGGKQLLSKGELLSEHRTCVCLTSTEVTAQAFWLQKLSISLQFPIQTHPAASHFSSWPQTPEQSIEFSKSPSKGFHISWCKKKYASPDGAERRWKCHSVHFPSSLTCSSVPLQHMLICTSQYLTNGELEFSLQTKLFFI